jgi:hypothetical protein
VANSGQQASTALRPKFGMLFSRHEPRNVPERFIELIPKVCTTAGVQAGLVYRLSFYQAFL